jgi:D-alanyl-D-alanine carboxypeptidase
LSQASLRDLIPELVPWAQLLFDVCSQAGANPTITSTLRTYSQQKALYDNYVAGRSKYPADKPGTSAHEFGYAFDMSMPWPGDLVQAGQLWVGWGGKYGGQRDPVHFEYPGFTVPSPAKAGASLPPDFGTASTSSWDALADLLVTWVPFFRIFGTVLVANALAQVFVGPNLVSFYLTHPVEFVRDVYREWWTLMSLLYGKG